MKNKLIGKFFPTVTPEEANICLECPYPNSNLCTPSGCQYMRKCKKALLTPQTKENKRRHTICRENIYR